MGIQVSLTIDPAHVDELAAFIAAPKWWREYSEWTVHHRKDGTVDRIHFDSLRSFRTSLFPQGSWGSVGHATRTHPLFKRLVLAHFPEAPHFFTSGAIRAIHWS